ncbi:hypothetical protein Tco_0469873 [Tanacetum coccineum]
MAPLKRGNQVVHIAAAVPFGDEAFEWMLRLVVFEAYFRCQRMLHGATAVTVAVMIVPLHTIYLPVAGVASLTETQFDLTPHMQSQRWADINAGIQQHLQKLYNTNNAFSQARAWNGEAAGSAPTPSRCALTLMKRTMPWLKRARAGATFSGVDADTSYESTPEFRSGSGRVADDEISDY